MAPMKVVSAVCVLLFAIGDDECSCYQCCTSYTDDYGVYHSPETCSAYCCKHLTRSNFKVCCTDQLRQVSSLEKNEGSCDNVAENVAENKAYVPVLATLIPLAIVAACLYYCCCKQTTRVTTVTTVVERY